MGAEAMDSSPFAPVACILFDVGGLLAQTWQWTDGLYCTTIVKLFFFFNSFCIHTEFKLLWFSWDPIHTITYVKLHF